MGKSWGRGEGGATWKNKKTNWVTGAKCPAAHSCYCYGVATPRQATKAPDDRNLVILHITVTSQFNQEVSVLVIADALQLTQQVNHKMLK